VAAIFISYRRDDSAGYAGRLHESLEQRLGEGRVFRDVDAFEPGQDFVQATEARLAGCAAFLAIMGREWLGDNPKGSRRIDQDDDFVRLEVAAALARPDLLVVPVLVEGAKMPAAADLPESIRALARRHAAWLRDETWDEDVDRLVRAVRKALGPPAASRHAGTTATVSSAGAAAIAAGAGWRKWAAIAAAGAVVAVAVALQMRGVHDSGARVATPQASERPATPPQDVPAAVASAASVPSPPTPAPTTSGATGVSAIATPRVAEVAYGSLIYTLLAGSIEPHSNTSTLRLRIRCSNDGRYDANFWDSTFRLAAAGQVLVPTSNLNVLVSSRADRQEVVSFEVPAGVTRAVLRVVNGSGGDVTELPLDLSPTARTPVTDRPNTDGAFSHAIVSTLLRGERSLVSGPSSACSLTEVTVRRFANQIRLVIRVRAANRGSRTMYLRGDTLRVVADGQSIGPVDAPNKAIAWNATETADFVFEVPPSTTSVTVRGVIDGAVGELPFDLPNVKP
jgi:TIR domain